MPMNISSRRISVLGISVLISLIAVNGVLIQTANTAENGDTFRLNIFSQSRPAAHQHIFDHAHLFEYSQENKEEMLRVFQEKYNVEMIIVTVAHLENQDISQVAAQLFTNWRIGQTHNGQGILILLADEEKQIKVEVGLGAEGVFTDLFCGYIERKQLKPYFENNQVDLGLSAMMEEFIGRAEGYLTDETIAQKMEDNYLSSGAGIAKKVRIGEFTDKTLSTSDVPAASATPATPDALYAAWMESLKLCESTPSLPIYTEASQMMFQYTPWMSQGLCEDLHQKYSHPHEILTQGDYGVILFPGGNQQGPIFMKKNSAGWQIDMLSTAKWVRYDFKNEWFLGGQNHPYAFAFKNKPYASFVRDIDFYDDYGTFSRIDHSYGEVIAQYQKAQQQNPQDFEICIQLAEIFFDLGIVKQSVPLLQKAVTIDAQDPRPYRYLGLINRDHLASPKTALEYLNRYHQLAPEDPYGYHYLAVTYWRLANQKDGTKYFAQAADAMKNFTEASGDLLYGYRMTGYFYYRMKNYSEAQKWFRKILEIDASHEYALKMLEKIRP
jgi:tetratricopeptide (TPR) repeat protein